MKLPLFVESHSVPSDSALVRLSEGEWVVESTHENAILNLSVNGQLHQDIRNGLVISIQQPTPVRASIVKAGTEKYISLYLSKCQSH